MFPNIRLLFLLALSSGCILVQHTSATGFYITALDPQNHKKGQSIPIYVNSLRSISEHVPYEYYKAPFCEPTVVRKPSPTLGSMITGDRMMSSNYVVEVLKNESCKLLPCSSAQRSRVRKEAAFLKKLITQGYRGGMSIENLPMFNPGVPVFNDQCKGNIPTEQKYPNQRGYALGVHKNCVGQTIVNNHIHMIVKYHVATVGETEVIRVVGFNGVPLSVKHSPDGGSCNPGTEWPSREPPLTIKDLKSNTTVWWSYSVEWREAPNIIWATRWDEYLGTTVADSNAKMHLYHIFGSLGIITVFMTIAASILMRTLHKDFNRYNSPDPDSNQEEVGWKFVHADVFRPPPYASMISILACTGVQIFFMCVTVLVFALIGFLSPANRGMLLSSVILTYTFMSFIGGYTCGKLLMMFDLKAWKAVFLSGLLFPGAVFVSYLFVNILNWHAGASDAVPFLVLFELFSLWILLSIPLTVLGASLAFQQEPIQAPVKVGRLPREIPFQKTSISPPVIYMYPALIPLSVIALEINLILLSFWQGRVYYVFGFLSIVFILWTIAVILVTIIAVYYMLAYENYRWWWSSMIVPGGFGVHIFLYFVYYYFMYLPMAGFTGAAVYFTVMFWISVAYGVVSGTIGLISSLVFTHTIYRCIKID
eukprot:Tbor_TRINITY_DN2956_c0_g1::TRINITY_DN2956_c0_g1_i1::g.1173::m.1173/K17086/TM9SF2_4; transmembrane 9 superfamily member 2/4